MAGRHDTWRRLRGDTDRPDLISYANKLLGYLQEQRRLGKAQSNTITRTLPDGSVVRAQFVGDQPIIEIRAGETSGAREEVIHLYVSSPGGLRIFDLGTKTLVKTITGLGDYTLQSVDRAGQIAYMAYNPPSAAFAAMARVDIPNMTAFAQTYAVNAPHSSDPALTQPGFASASQLAKLSPDGERVLFSYGGTQVGGVQQEGIGGFMLLDPETLELLREPIRMTYEPAPFAWSPDSQMFFLGTAASDDPGDDASDDRSQALTESVNDYVAMFDRDGTLLGTRQLGTWEFTPDAGWARKVLAIAVSADNRRLLVSVANTGMVLYLLDITDPSMPILDSLVTGRASQILLTNRGSKVTLLCNTGGSGDALEVSFENDVLVEVTSALDDELLTFAPTRSPGFDALQNGPDSRVGQPPDTRRFLLHIDPADGTRLGVSAFRAIDKPKVYEIDLTDYNVHLNYRLAAVGTRPAVRKPI